MKRHLLAFATAAIVVLLISAAILSGCFSSQPYEPGLTDIYEVSHLARDCDYVARRVFDLGGPGDFASGDSILHVSVYQEIQPNMAERPANAVYARLYVDPLHPDLYLEENRLLDSGTDGVVPIMPEDYQWYSVPDSNRHYVVFRGYPRDYAIGVWMLVKRNTGAIDTIGVDGLGTETDPKVLKLLHAGHSAVPTFHTWNYMWRNVYELPSGTEFENFNVKIFKGPYGTEDSATSVPYQIDSSGNEQDFMEVLGLDLSNGTGPYPDGHLDNRTAIFRPDWNLLIFPSRHPFADTTITFQTAAGPTQPLIDPVPGIYYYDSGVEKVQSSKYFLKYYTRVGAP